MTNTPKLDIHILLDTIETVAKGEKVEPEICMTVEQIAMDWDRPLDDDVIKAII